MTRLRPGRAEDAPALARIYAPYVTDGVVSFEAEPPDAPEMVRRMAAGGDLHPWLVAEKTGAVVGYAYAAPFRTRAAYGWAVETTIYRAGEAHGCGIGVQLYRALLDLLARQGFTQAVGVIALPNDASVRLHERLGFESAGVNRAVGWKRGRWIDVGVWQRALAPPADPPVPPLPVSAVLDRPGAPAAT